MLIHKTWSTGFGKAFPVTYTQMGSVEGEERKKEGADCVNLLNNPIKAEVSRDPYFSFTGNFYVKFYYGIY